MNKSADDGAVPLFLAAQEGHDACVEVLLEHGADANLMTHDNPALPLYAALQFNRLRYDTLKLFFIVTIYVILKDKKKSICEKKLSSLIM